MSCLSCILDIFNCMTNFDNCSQLCVEVEGSFNCSCYPGYELLPDGISCEGNQKYILYTYVPMHTYVHTYLCVHIHVLVYACEN